MKFTQLFNEAEENTSSLMATYINQYFGFNPVEAFPLFEDALTDKDGKKDSIVALYGLEGECTRGEKIEKSNPNFGKVLRRNEAIILDMAMTAMDEVSSFQDLTKYLSNIHASGKQGNETWKNDKERDKHITRIFQELKSKMSNGQELSYVAANFGITEDNPIKYSIKIIPYIISKIIGSTISVASGLTVGASAGREKCNILKGERPFIKEFCSASGESDDRHDLMLNVLLYTLMSLVCGNSGMKGYYGLVMYGGQKDRRGVPLSRDPETGDAEIISMMDSYLSPENENVTYTTKKAKKGHRKYIDIKDKARDIAIGRMTIEQAKMEYPEEINEIMAALQDANEYFVASESSVEPFALVSNITAHWVYLGLLALADKGSKTLNGIKIPDCKRFSNEELKDLKVNDPLMYDKALKNNATWDNFFKNRGKGVGNSISGDATIGSDNNVSAFDLLEDPKYAVAFNFNKDQILLSAKLFMESINKMLDLVSDGKLNSNLKKPNEDKIRVNAFYSTAACCKFAYMAINYPSTTIANTLCLTFGKKPSSSKASNSAVTVVQNRVMSSFTIDDDIEGLKVGTNNLEFRESLLVLRSPAAIDFYTNDSEGIELFDTIRRFLSSKYNFCKVQLRRLVGNRSIENELVSSAYYKAGCTRICDDGEKISDFGKDAKLELTDWQVGEAFDTNEGKRKRGNICLWVPAVLYKKARSKEADKLAQDYGVKKVYSDDGNFGVAEQRYSIEPTSDKKNAIVNKGRDGNVLITSNADDLSQGQKKAFDGNTKANAIGFVESLDLANISKFFEMVYVESNKVTA